MNQRDLAEIKRRLNPEKRNPSLIRGCYVNHVGNLITTFELSVATLYEQENEKYMTLFKKVLSGQLEQTLIPVAFPTEEMDQSGASGAYADLTRVRDTALQDEEAANALFERLIAGLRAEHPDMQSVSDAQTADNWLILLMHDTLDVRRRGADGEIDYDNSDRSFSYILCAICPVKRAKATLCYDPSDSIFHGLDSQWQAGSPVLGFLFPLFEDGAADINTVLLYSKDSNDAHEAFLEAAFHVMAVMPPAEQTIQFQTVLAQSLGSECSLDLVQEMHEAVSGMIAEQQKDKEAEPVMLSKKDVSRVLLDNGVSQEKAEAFENGFDAAFGAGAVLPAVNIVTPKQFKVDLPSVSIKVDPEHKDLLETRVIDGQSYLLIPIDGDISVNGQPVFI